MNADQPETRFQFRLWSRDSRREVVGAFLLLLSAVFLVHGTAEAEEDKDQPPTIEQSGRLVPGSNWTYHGTFLTEGKAAQNLDATFVLLWKNPQHLWMFTVMKPESYAPWRVRKYAPGIYPSVANADGCMFDVTEFSAIRTPDDCQTPLDVNHSTWRHENIDSEGIKHVDVFEAKGNEAITVPAGTFNTIRISRRSSQVDARGQESHVILSTLWYSPSVKALVKSIHKGSANYEGLAYTNETELERFDVSGADSPDGLIYSPPPK
jgi:hypothetical protein